MAAPWADPKAGALVYKSARLSASKAASRLLAHGLVAGWAERSGTLWAWHWAGRRACWSVARWEGWRALRLALSTAQSWELLWGSRKVYNSGCWKDHAWETWRAWQ